MAIFVFSVNFGLSKTGQAANVRYSVRDSSPATRIAATNTGIAEKLDAAGTTGTGSYSAIVSIDDSGWTFPVEVTYTITGQTGVGVVDTIYYSPSAVPATVTDKTGFALAITPPTAIQIRQEMDNNSTDLNAIITNIAAIKSDTAAVKAKTDNLPADPASNTQLKAMAYVLPVGQAKPAATVYLSTGATSPDLLMTLRDSQQQPIQIVGGSTITFTLKSATGTVIYSSSTGCSVEWANGGIIRFSWSTAGISVPAAGNYTMQFNVNGLLYPIEGSIPLVTR